MLRLSAFLLASLAALLLAPSSSSAGVNVVYDFSARHSDAGIANALTSQVSKFTSGGVQKQGFSLHPTKDDTTATYTVQLPKTAGEERLVMAFSAGMNEGFNANDPEHPYDGVKFALRVDGTEVFATDLVETKWIDGAVDLTPSAGKRIEVVFVTNPKTNSNYDWAVWGRPRILRLSKNLFAGNMSLPISKGIVVADYAMGPNTIEIRPVLKSAAKTVSSVKWTSAAGPIAAKSIAVVPFDFSAAGASGVSLVMSDQISLVQVYEYNPELEIVSFGPANALLFANTPAEIRCVVKNVGEGILNSSAGAKASLSANFTPAPKAKGKPASSSGPIALGSLRPGETKTLTWPGLLSPGLSPKASVEITGQGIAKVTSTWQGSVAKTPVSPPSKVAKPECMRLSDGTVVLQNPALRLTFLLGKDGYVGWMASVPKGDAWQVAATGPLGKVVIPGADSQPTTYQIHAADPKLANEPGESPVVRFTANKQIGAAMCRFEWTFSIDWSDPKVSMSNSMASDRPTEILHFSGPTVYAGDRGFGKAKDEGLFPGLEYLLSESSSGTENASPPYNLRTVPHPNKVTIPLMAVRKGTTLVTLEWDPLQKWDGSADRPAAVFASPNFLDGQDNHEMGIFAPSVPDWTGENQQIASKPYKLEPGKSLQLTGDLFVKSDSKTVLDAIDNWIADHDIPAPPETKSPPGQWLNLCESAYFESIWVEEAKAWKHTNTGPVYFDPMIANCILNRGNCFLEGEDKKKRVDFAQAAVEKAKDNLTLDIALLAGGVEGALTRMANSAKGLIAAQSPNGSWPFNPDEKHATLGKRGDTSSGHTANSAVEVLRYALISGDPKAREAGIKALNYLDTQTRPEGAQTWELQLHVPDILAAGRLVDAYLSGYLLTDDKKYLDRAVYWAKSGLPFVYMWNAQDRPIMRYGTIPVFGATWFDGQPWFGVCVQWCGLDYAYWISRLGEFDQTSPWKKIAAGILRCGVQQQEYTTAKYPEDKGMFPDAFSPIIGEEQYHWDLNPKLISRMALQSFGSDAFPRTSAVTDKNGARLAFTAPARSVKMTLEGEFLRVRVNSAPRATICAVLSGVRGPMAIGLVDRNLPQVGHIEMNDEGWQYIPETQTTIIKWVTSAEDLMTIDLLQHYMQLPQKAVTE
jgi:hypothetical protein